MAHLERWEAVVKTEVSAAVCRFVSVLKSLAISRGSHIRNPTRYVRLCSRRQKVL